MSESTTCATPLEVLDAAIETLSAPDGYNVHTYHGVPYRNEDEEFDGYEDAPVAVATMHCAIGGVEHAIWKLCGDDVTDRRDEYAYTGSSKEERCPTLYPRKRPRKPTLVVYQTVMKALNEETRARDLGGDVEQATFSAPKDTVLDIFRAARARLA